MSSLKDIKTSVAKTPRVIKVSTVITSVVVALAIIGSFVAGWTMRASDQARVEHEAKALVSKLKSQE